MRERGTGTFWSHDPKTAVRRLVLNDLCTYTSIREVGRADRAQVTFSATWCDDEGMKAFIVDHDDLGWSAVYGFGGGAPIYFVLRDDTVPHDRLREQIGYQDIADAHWQDDPTLDDGPPAPLCVTRELTWAEILGHRSEVGTPLQ